MIWAAFAGNPLAKYLAVALVATVAIGGSYIKGRHDGEALKDAEVAAEKAKWEARIAASQKQHEVHVAEIRSEYGTKIGGYQRQIDQLSKRKPGVITETITRTVEVFVPKEVDKPIPKGLVELHKIAAAGDPLPETPPPDAAKPTETKLSDIGTTVAENYYNYHIVAARLEALQKIVREYQLKQKELTQ